MPSKTVELLNKINTKVSVIEEHIKIQNGRVLKNEKKIESIEKIVLPLDIWDKIKTTGLVILSGTCGSLVSYIIFH